MNAISLNILAFFEYIFKSERPVKWPLGVGGIFILSQKTVIKNIMSFTVKVTVLTDTPAQTVHVFSGGLFHPQVLSLGWTVQISPFQTG